MKHLSAGIMSLALLFALLFWLADSVYEFYMFRSNLEFMLYQEPLSFRDSFIANIPPHALFNRLSFLAASILGGIVTVILMIRWRESETRYRMLSDNFPNGALFLFDHRFRYLVVGGKGLKKVGLAPEQVTGRTIQNVFPDLWEIIRPHCEKALNGEESYYEVAYGGRVYANTAIPVKGTDGAKHQGIVVTQDITRQKIAAEEKAALETQLHQSQKLEAIGRLAGGVAHDLNNLLSPILGYGEMLMEDFTPEDDRHSSLHEIVHAGYRARDLVRQLLAFGRKQTLEYTAVDLNETVSNFQKLLRRTIREDIDLVFFPAPRMRPVLADIGQIEQVIMNLAVNAQDAMKAGGHLTIETALVELDDDYAAKHAGVTPGPHAMLAVSDTGCGMDETTQANIFEPFFSTKGEHGTGLGLATVYGIVKQHGGNIWVYSEIGKGTTFKVYLPVASHSDRPCERTEEPAGDLIGMETILLVEDDESVRRLGRKILARQGYTVLEADDAAQALALQASFRDTVHLLVTDVVMPGMNGKELFLKLTKRQPGLKVLYMSGYTDNVIAHHGVLDKGIQFIQKPFAVNALARKVRQVLDLP